MAAYASAGDPLSTTTLEEKAIEDVLVEFVGAWNRHDAKAFSMVFAEDADFTNVAGVSVRGRPEVESFHAPRFASHFKDSRRRIVSSKIRFIDTDVAVVDVRWEMTGARTKDGQAIPLRRGLLALVMVKQSEKWLIAVMHNLDPTDKQK